MSHLINYYTPDVEIGVGVIAFNDTHCMECGAVLEADDSCFCSECMSENDNSMTDCVELNFDDGREF